jgi:hypothetical protein
MNVDRILETMNGHRVAYLLVGGMNFLLRHAPVLTYDVELWIDDTEQNRRRCEQALAVLQAEWGASEGDWGPVAEKPPGWLARQAVFCLTSPHGAIDVFRSLEGLGPWRESRRAAQPGTTASGTAYLALSDADMLKCQMALPESSRNPERIRTLSRALAWIHTGPLWPNKGSG